MDSAVEIDQSSERKPESGAEYFRRHYMQLCENSAEFDLAHMDLGQLETMASSTVGTVTDEEDLTFEVVGAVFSGNTAEIVLRVTAKNLETLWNDEGGRYYSNYQFSDDTFMMGFTTLGESWDVLAAQYYYCEPEEMSVDYQTITYSVDETLAPNQLMIHYWIVTPEPLAMDIFQIPLMDFGKYNKEGQFEVLYGGQWQVDIAVDPADEGNKQMIVNEEIKVNEYSFLVEDIQLTPLACTVHLTCQGDAVYIDEHAEGIQQTIWDGRSTFGLRFSDGSSLSVDPMKVDANSCEDKYQQEGGSYYDEYHVLYQFDVPISVEDVESVELFEKEIFFK